MVTYVVFFVLGAISVLFGSPVIRRLRRGRGVLAAIFEPLETIGRRWPAAFEGLLVFVTTVYVVFAALQWTATRDNVELTKKILVSSNRPWVTLGSIALPEMKPDTPTTGRVTLLNTGRSLALDFKAQVASVDMPADYRIPETPPYLGVPGTGSVIALGPGQSIALDVKLRSYTAEQIARFKSSNRKLVIYGAAEYHDEFGQEGGLKFCGSLEPDGSFTACAEHNVVH